MPVQSILIARNIYSIYTAIRWVEEHGYVVQKIHKTQRYYRFRQYTPIPGEHYRTIRIAEGVKLVITIP